MGIIDSIKDYFERTHRQYLHDNVCSQLGHNWYVDGRDFWLLTHRCKRCSIGNGDFWTDMEHEPPIVQEK